MKTCLSIFELFVRCCTGKVTAVLAIFAAAECGWLGLRLAMQAESFNLLNETWLMAIIFVVTLFVLSEILTTAGTAGRHSQTIYLVNRLRAPAVQIIAVQTFYNLLAYLWLWAGQALIALGFARLYAGLYLPELMQRQYSYLLFHEDGFLGLVLPVGRPWACAGIGLLILFLSLMDALAFRKQLRGKRSGSISGIVPFLVLMAEDVLNGVSGLIAILICTVVVEMSYRTYRKRVDGPKRPDDEDEEGGA